ncbi:ABC transporter [Alishewanella agri BL06]|uniref:ABC transporter n=2 Tax=Alishewanella TaxID=111142 RepID=I9DUH6_9ALTE|nr:MULTISPECIES: ATP-binding cassette domain-containing protein [Alishewanella]EIW89805.1 ABC transporter [Alishewanella agri BL06]EJI85606.1 ABC transporter [Alishewanella aestuarii B11]KRS20653.1 ABC transporter [Alishewanella sp. WH16-1]
MIEIKNLAKAFALGKGSKLSDTEKQDVRYADKEFRSVRDVSFHCGQGEVLGLLGPNGAGKTTTLRMLSTALKPDAGSVLINGVDVLREPVKARKQIGFLSADTGLYGKLSAYENIAYFGRLHGMKEAALKQRIDELFTMLNMHDFASRRADNMSTGMKQKTAIARAVVHSPKVVILDEPTTGLDIMTVQTVLDFIKGLKQVGTPVIFSTHHLDEVASLCDRVVVIDKGISAFSGDLAEFKALAPTGDLRDAFLAVLKQQSNEQGAA